MAEWPRTESDPVFSAAGATDAEVAAALAQGVALAPNTSARNVVQPTTDARPLTIRSRASGDQWKDLFRIEHADGSPLLRFGRGGAGVWTDHEVEEPDEAPNLILYSPDVSGGGGALGVATPNGSEELSMTAGQGAGSGVGPHLFLGMGFGRPPEEYNYTEIVHKHNHLHMAADGVEHYGADQEHFFFGVWPVDEFWTAGDVVFRYVQVTDRVTGRTIWNPGADYGAGSPGPAFPETYEALHEMRSQDAAVPVLRLKAEAGQLADLFEVRDSGGALLSAISESGYFTTRKTAAPADGELANGEVALWWNAVTGALSFKGKRADGAVSSGSMAGS